MLEGFKCVFKSHAHDLLIKPTTSHTGGQRDLSYSYWPKQHNFFGFAYGITDRYIRSMWDETNLLAYDDGALRNRM